MGLESATYISGLTASNPISGDGVAQGDNHIRLVKAVLASTFPNANKEFYFPGATGKSASFSAAVTDEQETFPVDASGGAVTVTLPVGSGLSSGYVVTVLKTDGSSNAVIVARTGSDTINRRTSWIFSDPYSGGDFVWTGSLWIVKSFGSEAGLATGDLLWTLSSGARTGFIIPNATTIGSASSGAAQRANADVERLFNYLWNNLSDTVCAVTAGRGASAAADWASNKIIATPDLRGRGPFGLDTMGGSAAGRILDATVTGGGGDSDTEGGTGGAETHTLTLAESPVHDHDYNDPGHTHASGSSSIKGDSGTPTAVRTISVGTIATSSEVTGITHNPAGGGNAHPNMTPFMLGTYYMKL